MKQLKERSFLFCVFVRELKKTVRLVAEQARTTGKINSVFDAEVGSENNIRFIAE